MGSLAKVLRWVGKYAWIVALIAGFALFLPDDAARRIPLYALAHAYPEVLWAVLAVSAALSAAALLMFVYGKITGWLRDKRAAGKRKELEKQTLGALALKLESLSQDEKMWIKYCLFHDTQRFFAPGGTPVSDALRGKGLVEEGTGHLLNMPFVIPDQIWRYLIEHRDEFLDKNEIDDTRFAATLEKFRKSLGPQYRM